MDILAVLRERFVFALATIVPNADSYLPLIRATKNSKLGDFQANMAMPIAKSLGRETREIANEIVARLQINDLCEPAEIVGPGFINLRIRDDRLAKETSKLTNDDRLGVSLAATPRKIVIDFSSPNVAKPMHVGHIRSTVIGDALTRIYRFLGHEVVSDNHIGDWGSQFGMILYGYKHFLDSESFANDSVAELARLYRLVSELAKNQPEIAEAARQETAKLHAGNFENMQLWCEFMPVCLASINRVYDRLGVNFDETIGESFYRSMLSAVVDDLIESGIATESEGAVCVFNDGFSTPWIIRKSDGSFLYATTDLATIVYRLDELDANEILYVVDKRQSEHFEQLFATARRWGSKDLTLKHVSFGTILGNDKKPFKTRSGDTVGLESLLDEAVEQAYRVVSENTESSLPEIERRRIAEIVGIGGIKYADLKHNRESDYVFSWEKMLSTTGDSATYMQYAYARAIGIIRNSGVNLSHHRSVSLTIDDERNLALLLNRFAECVEGVVDDNRPNVLTNYLLTLTETFATFYNNCPVLKVDDEDIRLSRLLLCDLTARTIKQGLELLGIAVVERM